jgi:curved DNA-binding protein CbpA
MTSDDPDHYAVLGVHPGASPTDIDRAYRRAARATHPDLHPNDGSAAERFRAATIAYETLSDPERRASYDHGHSHTRPRAAARIAVHQRPSVAPVHLGREPGGASPLRPFHPTAAPAKDLSELLDAFERMIGRWPYR